MKKYVLAGIIAVLAFEMTGCTPGNNVPGSTLVGAGAGGLLGTAIFHNQVAGAIGGALIGGVIGDQVGQYMDRRDQEKMESAATTVPIGQQASWQNSKGAQYTVTPVKDYHNTSNQYCREYQTTVTVNGKTQNAYGRACRQPDGSWKIVS